MASENSVEANLSQDDSQPGHSSLNIRDVRLLFVITITASPANMQLAAVAKPQVVVPGGREGLVFLPAKLVQQVVNLEFAEMYICELLPES